MNAKCIDDLITNLREASEAVPESDREWEAWDPADEDRDPTMRFISIASPANVLRVLGAIPRWRTGEPPHDGEYLVRPSAPYCPTHDLCDFVCGQWRGLDRPPTHWMPIPEEPHD